MSFHVGQRVKTIEPTGDVEVGVLGTVVQVSDDQVYPYQVELEGHRLSLEIFDANELEAI